MQLLPREGSCLLKSSLQLSPEAAAAVPGGCLGTDLCSAQPAFLNLLPPEKKVCIHASVALFTIKMIDTHKYLNK